MLFMPTSREEDHLNIFTCTHFNNFIYISFPDFFLNNVIQISLTFFFLIFIYLFLAVSVLSYSMQDLLLQLKKEVIGPGIHLRPAHADHAWPPLQ